jgi:hypothetical protein
MRQYHTALLDWSVILADHFQQVPAGREVVFTGKARAFEKPFLQPVLLSCKSR